MSTKRLLRDNRLAISGLHPIAHERHCREQRSAIALKLIFGYLNCRPSNIVVKYTREGGNSLLSTKGGWGGGQLLKRSSASPNRGFASWPTTHVCLQTCQNKCLFIAS